MPAFTNGEYADMHFVYGFCNGNGLAAQREYRVRFPKRVVPCVTTFARIHSNIHNRGTVHRATREQGFANDDTDDAIIDIIENNPTESTRMIAQRLGVSQWKVWQSIRSAGLYPYHYQKVQSLEDNDYQQRIDFCRLILHRDVDDVNFLKSILWTDESIFTRDGVYNYHNQHQYASENPHNVHQGSFQRRFNINLWAGIIGNRLIGPFEMPSSVDGRMYLNFLINNLPELLEEIPLETRIRMIFQHDGAPPHFMCDVRTHLNDNYPGWIGRGGHVSWPPRSPDLTPMDFYVWGRLKDKVYENEITSYEGLRARLTIAINELRVEISRNRKITVEGVRRRARLCIQKKRASHRKLQMIFY